MEVRLTEIIAKRMRELREGVHISQMKIAKTFGIGQSSIFRYESGETAAPAEVLLKYADYFDVSLDYIFGRTDDPHGTAYAYRPKIEQSYPEMDKFIEMCFDPSSPMNAKLKETLRQMMKEGE